MTVAWGLSFGGATGAWGVSWGSDAAVQPAAGPQVVLLPLQDLHFRTRADYGMYALATYIKHCAMHTREEYPRLIPEFNRGTQRGSLRF